jgi:glycine dehydrogenase subunit 1
LSACRSRFICSRRWHREGRALDDLAEQGYLAGLELGRWYPEMADCLSVAVTEKRTRAEIDRYVDTFEKVVK